MLSIICAMVASPAVDDCTIRKLCATSINTTVALSKFNESLRSVIAIELQFFSTTITGNHMTQLMNAGWIIDSFLVGVAMAD
jgi:hypothetical protein